MGWAKGQSVIADEGGVISSKKLRTVPFITMAGMTMSAQCGAEAAVTCIIITSVDWSLYTQYAIGELARRVRH